MNNRNFLFLIFLVVLAIVFIHSIMFEIYSNNFNCKNKICTVTSKSCSHRIIQQDNIDLNDIAFFSYSKNVFKSKKHHIVYDINAQKKDGTNVKITETTHKMPFEMKNIISKLNNLLGNDLAQEVNF